MARDGVVGGKLIIVGPAAAAPSCSIRMEVTKKKADAAVPFMVPRLFRPPIVALQLLENEPN